MWKSYKSAFFKAIAKIKILKEKKNHKFSVPKENCQSYCCYVT